MLHRRGGQQGAWGETRLRGVLGGLWGVPRGLRLLGGCREVSPHLGGVYMSLWGPWGGGVLGRSPWNTEALGGSGGSQGGGGPQECPKNSPGRKSLKIGVVGRVGGVPPPSLGCPRGEGL